MIVRGLSLTFQAFARQRMQVIVLEFEIDTMNILTQMPESKVQAISPLAQAVPGLGKHPGDSAYRGKIDLAGAAAEFACPIILRQRRLVASGAGQQIWQAAISRHMSFSSVGVFRCCGWRHYSER